jgi:hypothetical protein
MSEKENDETAFELYLELRTQAAQELLFLLESFGSLENVLQDAEDNAEICGTESEQEAVLTIHRLLQEAHDLFINLPRRSEP